MGIEALTSAHSRVYDGMVLESALVRGPILRSYPKGRRSRAEGSVFNFIFLARPRRCVWNQFDRLHSLIDYTALLRRSFSFGTYKNLLHAAGMAASP